MADPTQATLEERVRAFVAEATGLDVDQAVIPGNDNSPAPTIPYATVLEITKQGDGIDHEVARAQDQENTTLSQGGRRTAIFSIQFFKDGAADNAETLLSYPSTTAGRIFLAENSLTWRRAGDIRNIDGIVSGERFEQRRSVDIEIRYQSTRQVAAKNLASAEIDLTLSAETDLNETLEVTDA